MGVNEIGTKPKIWLYGEKHGSFVDWLNKQFIILYTNLELLKIAIEENKIQAYEVIEYKETVSYDDFLEWTYIRVERVFKVGEELDDEIEDMIYNLVDKINDVYGEVNYKRGDKIIYPTKEEKEIMLKMIDEKIKEQKTTDGIIVKELNRLINESYESMIKVERIHDKLIDLKKEIEKEIENE